MRVWIDMTARAHVLVFRPLIALLRERGAEIEITAREYAQTLELLERHGIDPQRCSAGTAGRSRAGKLRALASRLHSPPQLGEGPQVRRRARARLARADAGGTPARDPERTTFDYEFATVQHQLGCRAATRVVVPEAIPPERLAPYGVARRSSRAIPA